MENNHRCDRCVRDREYHNVDDHANDGTPSMEGLPESIKTSPKRSKTDAQAPEEFTIPADRKPPEDFKLIDNIIIVHTDERIKI